jgi:hypothetical protein
MKRWFLLLCISLVPSIALCQSTNATISGGVTDVTGNLILDADVEIANDATGVIYSARTNNSGMYLVRSCLPAITTSRSRSRVSRRSSKQMSS